MKEEYDREHQRTANLDNKVSVFIAALIAVLTIFIPVIPYKGIVKAFKVRQCHTGIILLLIFLGLSAFFIVSSFIELYQSFSLKGFCRPNLEAINAQDNLEETEKNLLDVLIDHYHFKVIQNNKKENDHKAKHLKIGLLLFIIGFIMMFIAVVMLNFFTV